MGPSSSSYPGRAAISAGALAAASALLVAWVGAGERATAGEGSQPGRAGVRLEQVGQFDRPTYVHQPPSGADGLLFVVEQPGRIKVMEMASGDQHTFLDIAGKVSSGGERGLLSVAFAPDYATSGLFYVYYTQTGGDLVIEEYRTSGDLLAADQSSAREVLEIEHSRFPNHNGGQLQFGPDGLLYIGTGDGGGFGDPAENAQSRNSLLGKLLRIDPSGGKRYGVPKSNPFVGRKGRDEIYARGLRNPWRFSFDRGSKHIVIGDVGQDRREEVDYETLKGARGANFGWDAFEGFARFQSPDASKPPKRHDRPIEDYSLSGGNCAITGGYVVRDPSLPSLEGRYVYADFCGGVIRSLIPKLDGGRDDNPLGPEEPSISSFGEDAAGRVYVASLSTGRVSVLAPG
jgi:glucose/arabinose dehydrogenase